MKGGTPVQDINSLKHFYQVINGEQYSLVEFVCEDCTQDMLAPFDALAGTDERVKLYKVDIDAQEDVSHEVAIDHSPTFLLFKKGGDKIGRPIIGGDNLGDRLKELIAQQVE